MCLDQRSQNLVVATGNCLAHLGLIRETLVHHVEFQPQAQAGRSNSLGMTVTFQAKDPVMALII